jgi:PadR family transcriptional regulator PadR
MKSPACGKVVIQNFFEPCVLFLLSRGPAHGYLLLKELQARCRCETNVGGLYRGLERLRIAGYVEKRKEKGEKGPDKAVYQLTDSGRTYLASWIAELDTTRETIDTLITNYRMSL